MLEMPRRVHRSSLDELVRYAEEERKRLESSRAQPDVQPHPRPAFIIEIVDDEADSRLNNPAEPKRLKTFLQRRAAYVHAS
jgi:hypothetical protein